MAKKPQYQISKEALRKKLEEDVETFLQNGGVIETVEAGKSGIESKKTGSQAGKADAGQKK